MLFGQLFQVVLLTSVSHIESPTTPLARCASTLIIRRSLTQIHADQRVSAFYRSAFDPRTCATHKEFRLFPFRSPLLRESHAFSFPGGTEMFQFPPCPSYRYNLTFAGLFTIGCPAKRDGLPHSETAGSKV